ESRDPPALYYKRRLIVECPKYAGRRCRRGAESKNGRTTTIVAAASLLAAIGTFGAASAFAHTGRLRSGVQAHQRVPRRPPEVAASYRWFLPQVNPARRAHEGGCAR